MLSHIYALAVLEVWGVNLPTLSFGNTFAEFGYAYLCIKIIEILLGFCLMGLMNLINLISETKKSAIAESLKPLQ